MAASVYSATVQPPLLPPHSCICQDIDFTAKIFDLLTSIALGLGGEHSVTLWNNGIGFHQTFNAFSVSTLSEN